jgi:ABC-type uncharacterized transport system fused permease/ATPase subunit
MRVNYSIASVDTCCIFKLVIPAQIVWVDEATAAVDLATDRALQEAMRTQLRGRTVVTIAHRYERRNNDGFKSAAMKCLSFHNQVANAG